MKPKTLAFLKITAFLLSGTALYLAAWFKEDTFIGKICALAVTLMLITAAVKGFRYKLIKILYGVIVLLSVIVFLPGALLFILFLLLWHGGVKNFKQSPLK